MCMSLSSAIDTIKDIEETTRMHLKKYLVYSSSLALIAVGQIWGLTIMQTAM